MKWYSTPGWWWRVPLIIGLLAGGALVEGEVPAAVSTAMLVTGLLLLAHGWVATIVNIQRINKQVAEEEARKAKQIKEA